MTDYIVKDTSLTAVADKIRAKTGSNSPITFPTGFESEIDSIETSAEAYADALEETYGSGQTPAPTNYKYVEITSLNATENGTYTAPEGTAYGSVVVNVLPPQTPSDALLFYSPNEIGLGIANATKNWDGTLYYSTDHTNWTEWDGTTQIVSALSDGYHKIYLRGVGNTVITGHNGNTYGFSLVGSFIKCVGNLNNLLDYTTEPTLGQYAFAYMFYECRTVDFNVTLPALTLSLSCYDHMFSYCDSLTVAPDLPATILTNSCYNFMFDHCYALKVPPKLPATTLAYACYTYMFNWCKSLVSLPLIPARVLEVQSCYSMFFRCDKIKLSISQSEEYYNEYRIPANGTGTDATQALKDMFVLTGGTFKGTPTINTTYYTSNTIIPAT